LRPNFLGERVAGAKQKQNEQQQEKPTSFTVFIFTPPNFEAGDRSMTAASRYFPQKSANTPVQLYGPMRHSYIAQKNACQQKNCDL